MMNGGGNPLVDRKVHDYIFSYSYQNIAEQAYPSILITGSTIDNRVPASQPMKYFKRLKSIIQMRALQYYYPCKTNMAILAKVEDTDIWKSLYWSMHFDKSFGIGVFVVFYLHAPHHFLFF